MKYFFDREGRERVAISPSPEGSGKKKARITSAQSPHYPNKPLKTLYYSISIVFSLIFP